MTDYTQNYIKAHMQVSYETLLMNYAAGSLDESQSLIMSAHVSLSPYARRTLAQYEALGGALLDRCCDSVTMTQDAFSNVMEKIEGEKEAQGSLADLKETTPQKPKSFFDGVAVPSCMQTYLDSPDWQQIYPGMYTQNVNTSCAASKVRLLKVDPGVKTPEHSHSGTEITLMLEGAFHDETGTYSRGDLIIIDEDFTHQPIADERTGCVCLVVTTAPIKLTGWKRLFNPFLKN